MRLVDFTSEVIASEVKCVDFLRKYGIFNETTLPCRVDNCGNDMRFTSRKSPKGERIPVWKCKGKKCRRFRSVRSTNSFFTWRDRNGKLNSKLSLRAISVFIFVWIHTTLTIDQAMKLSGSARQTVVDWFNLAREVCSNVIAKQPKLVGTEESPIQIDESYFSGKRKYNRGRLLNWDRSSTVSNSESIPSWGEEEPEPDSDESEPTNRRNYGNRVVGPWVLGIYKSKTEVRFIVIPNRTSETLISVITQHVQGGSVIITDEWAGYRRLSNNNYVHKTVNHSENYVDPDTGAHTQGIERQWVDAKCYMKRARKPGKFLQSHLDELSWRKLRSTDAEGLFPAFLKDVATNYRTSDQ